MSTITVRYRVGRGYQTAAQQLAKMMSFEVLNGVGGGPGIGDELSFMEDVTLVSDTSASGPGGTGRDLVFNGGPLFDLHNPGIPLKQAFFMGMFRAAISQLMPAYVTELAVIVV